MKINLSGHHVDVSDSIREHIEEKIFKNSHSFSNSYCLGYHYFVRAWKTPC